MSMCFFLKLFSSLLLFFSKNILLMWISLEINLYSSLPMLLYTSGYLGSVFIYIMTKIFGSLFFFVGSVYSVQYNLLFLGVFLKLSYFPLFFWMPMILSDFNWVGCVVMLVMKKIPSFYLYYFFKGQENNVFIILTLFFISKLILFKNPKNLKSLIAWSSVVQTTVLLLLMESKVMWFVVYFFFYSLSLSVLCFLSGRKNYKELSFNKKNFFKNKEFVSLVIFIFSGIPPFVVFFYKILLLYSLNPFFFWGFVMMFSLGFYYSFISYFTYFMKKVLSKNGVLKNKFFLNPFGSQLFLFLNLLFIVMWIL